jgi:isopentenyl phosphate kinase
MTSTTTSRFSATTSKRQYDEAWWPSLSQSGLTILKLGGSVITEKTHALSARPKVIDRIACELSSFGSELILIHGAGSFGHPIVKKYGIGLGHADFRRIGVSETKLALMELNSLVVRALKNHKIPSVPFMPSCFMTAEEGRLTSMTINSLKRMLDTGYVPVLHGDLIPDSHWGVSVVSGDQMAVQLAKDLKASLVIFGCDVDGVFTSDPRLNRHAELVSQIRYSELERWIATVGGSTETDVTGGMRGKLVEIAKLADDQTNVIIFNLAKRGNLKRLLNGDRLDCTRIVHG